MPKEKIYDDAALFDIEVGWSSGQQVQLGIATHSGVSIADWMAGSKSESVAAELVSDLPSFNSLWASLDRTGCNRLIRMLRKARDAAYGVDE